MNNRMNSVKRVLLTGALAVASVNAGEESNLSPAARDEFAQVPVERTSSAVDAAWFNTTLSNVYTTAGAVAFNTTPVINSDLGITYKGVSADVYANHVFKDGKVNDLEFTVAYSPRKLDNKFVAINPSIGYWIFPSTGFDPAVAAKVGVSPKRNLFGLDSSLSATKLWAKETNGTMYEANVSKSFPVGKGKIAAGVEAAYNDRQYSDESNFACITPAVSFNYPLPFVDGADLTFTYKHQSPSSEFKHEGAVDRNIFKVKLNFNLKKFGRKI